MPNDLFWYCSFTLYIMLSSSMCSNLFVVSMTFQRFYSIIRPHKAASFNTVKRTKITVVCILVFSLFFRFPHLFTSYFRERICFTYSKLWGEVFTQFYYWVTFALVSDIPFVSLIIMNSIIIKTLRQRSRSNLIETVRVRKKEGRGQDQGHDKFQGQVCQSKHTEHRSTPCCFQSLSVI